MREREERKKNRKMEIGTERERDGGWRMGRL